MENYKLEALAHMSKEELLDYIKIDPHFVEFIEAKRMGAVHTGVGNGPDAYLNGREVEIKTQVWNGNYQLRGRGKFGAVSMSMYKRKLESNELINIVGYCPASGQVFYRFYFDFAAIADYYLHTVNLSEGKNWGNADILPKHYIQHESFRVDYVAPVEILLDNQHIFIRKFLVWLIDWHNTDGSPNNLIITSGYKQREEYSFEDMLLTDYFPSATV